MILADTALHVILATLFALIALLLMGVILLQRGRGTGLSGAFGGGGAATVFGSKTGDFLTWTTVALAGLFLVYSVSLNYIFVPPKAGLSGPAPVIAPAPPPAGSVTIPAQPSGGATGAAAPGSGGGAAPTPTPATQPGG